MASRIRNPSSYVFTSPGTGMWIVDQSRDEAPRPRRSARIASAMPGVVQKFP
ncbi:hypothetical protein G4G27_22515 [Sphingomonas sp. So64.6b]|uniref:hypothetical protein n=1 Tax=Sphingomonas sp. So64.6b TaxID=2997354 RepID=UPI001602DDFC|nr:hypothetical protein [Sphingomonas sp. So64.6b]QNA86443.1 hypothetical protein G4G27_22515 [Sphingomonas sp. So64.6b]